MVLDTRTYMSVRIDLGSGASVVPNDKLELLDGVIRANSNSLFYARGQSVTISQPNNPVTPQAYIQAPTTVGSVSERLATRHKSKLYSFFTPDGFQHTVVGSIH